MSKTIENTHNTIDGYENENSRDSGEDQLAVTVNFVNKRIWERLYLWPS